MCPPLNDLAFFDLMTEKGTKNIDLIKKYHSELNYLIL